MRQILYTLVALATVPAVAQTSPSINRSDMPAAGDTLRLSAAAPLLPASAPPLTQRGANQTWNYGSLVPVSQSVERYVALSTLPRLYQTYFGPIGGPNRSSFASPQELPLPPGLPLALTNPYQFFYLSTANAVTQDYRSVGFGGTVNGVSVPVPYQGQPQQDIIYRFPLSYSSQPDSSNSFFSASLPGVGYLSQRRKRVNRPDAWGTLTTPFGTFQTVRVVTRLLDHDSISLGGVAGQGITRPVTREYKWLAKSQHVPVLTITTQELLGRETITAVRYRDRYRRIALSARDAATDKVLAAYPNPSAVGSALTLSVPANSGPLMVTATDLAGRRLFSQMVSNQSGHLTLAAEWFGQFRGVALLTVTTARGTATRRVVRQ